MPVAGIVTLVLAVLFIAAAALGLLRALLHLKEARMTLGTVVLGVMVVAHQTRTVPASVAYVNDELKPVRDFCETI